MFSLKEAIFEMFSIIIVKVLCVCDTLFLFMHIADISINKNEYKFAIGHGSMFFFWLSVIFYYNEMRWFCFWHIFVSILYTIFLCNNAKCGLVFAITLARLC